jgi:hypothetical protein
MTAPVGNADNEKFGPGTLTIGATGSEIDASCYVNGLRITATADRGDSKTMLCGTTKAGSVRYDYEMTGNLDLDLNSGAEGLFALSQEYPGSTQPFIFTPNTAGGTSAAGSLVLDPMDFGADEYGAIMSSDVTWTLVGQPEYTYSTGAVATISGVTAGTPGSFQPSGVTPPADLAALKADAVVGDSGTNKPGATPWTTGQSVVLGTGSAHWDGSAWVTGAAA